MTRKYFGTDGIRGRVGSYPITPDFMLRLGWAAGRVFAGQGGSQLILIGKDPRISGYMLESVLEAGITSAGVDVKLMGVMPTPGIAYLTRTFRADAGIVISASHNPYYDNGIKFFSGDGNKLPDEVEASIEAELDLPMTCVPSESLGKAARIDDAHGRYVEYCKATFGGRRLSGLKVVLDCANGATYNTAPLVFEELGAHVIRSGVNPNGLNINEECGAVHPEGLAKLVRSEQADLGISFDGDGDRVIMVDGRGSIVDGDAILYAIAAHRKSIGTMQGGVVGTLMTNLGLERAFGELGLPFERADVGDRYVLERLYSRGWQLGGEASGHIVCLDLSTTGDGIVAALQVLAALSDQDKDLMELTRPLERLPQVLVNVNVQDPAMVVKHQAVIDAAAATEAGLEGRGRVLLRPSGTEPKVRVMVEGDDEAEVTRAANELAGAVRASVGA